MAVLRDLDWYSLKFIVSSCSSFFLLLQLPGTAAGFLLVQPMFEAVALLSQMQDFRGDPLGGMPIPKRRALTFLSLASQDDRQFGVQPARLRSDQDVRPEGDGDGALGGGAQGEARNPQVGGLLLDAARIG